MANEIRIRHENTGQTLYALVFNAAGQVWNTDTEAFAAFAVASLADYAVALAESPASSYRYAASFPAAVTGGGRYRVEIFEQAGAAPAIGDVLLADGELFWSGSAEVDAMAVLLAVTAGKAAYDAATGVWTVKGLDGNTTVMEITLAGSGVRTAVSLP